MIKQEIRDTVLKELDAARLSSARAYVLLKGAGLSEKDSKLIAYAFINANSVYNLIQLSMENEAREHDHKRTPNEPREKHEDFEI